MVNRRTNDLNYGHFGQPIYDTEAGQWFFGRTPGRKHVFRQLGLWKTVVAAAVHLEETAAPDGKRTLRKALQDAKVLVKNNSDLTPAYSLLPDEAITSAAITSVVSTYDPAVGDLLSFGRAAQASGTKRHFLAAVPTGESGNILRLLLGFKFKHGWEITASPFLDIPSLDEESGWWTESCAPIQQLCFSQSDDRSNFLAVRTPTKTTIFRPLYYDDSRPSSRSLQYVLPPSRLSPRRVLEITLGDTGGVPHADVTFNPEYQRQVAIVDQKGGWSVWDIEHGYQNRLNYRISCTNRSSISRIESEDDTTKVLQKEDGWARILWVGDVNTILVSNRRKLDVFDIRGEVGLPTILKCPQIIAPQTPDWILDVKRSPRKKSQFFVLTSSSLHLMEVHTLTEWEGSHEVESGVSILLTWQHFRGGDDTTLQLCIASGVEDGKRSNLVFFQF